MTSPSQSVSVQIPQDAVAGDDILMPSQALLRGLSLLGEREEMDAAGQPKAAITGPATSVALIEAGATAASKWWATGGAAAVTGMWITIKGWWGSTTPENQHIALWAGAIISSAVVLGIAHLLAADVRGRGEAAAQTVLARARVAEAFIKMAERANEAQTARSSDARSNPALAEPAVTPLPGLPVKNVHASDQDGWCALALLTDGSTATRYLVAKGTTHEWMDADGVEI